MRVDPNELMKLLLKNEGRVRQTAREAGVSPSTVIFWRKRAKSVYTGKFCISGLKRRSTKPKATRSTTLTAKEQTEIKALRRQYGYGAAKLKVLTSTAKHVNTIHRFLGKQGLTAPGKNYRRPRYQKTTHMYLKNVDKPGKLQMDVKYVTPELSGLPHTTYLYAVIDIWSRWKQGVILPAIDQALAIEALGILVPLLPPILQDRIDFIQTDNGLEFQKRFHDHVTTKLGWKHHYIHKSSPNENAVIERSFRTDEEEFFWRIDRPKDPIELNQMYQDYLNTYNTFRPHMGLNYLTPEEKLLEFSV